MLEVLHIVVPVFALIALGYLSSISGFLNSNVGEGLADHFYALAKKLGLQTSLREMNIEESALEDLASQAMDQQRLLINNPREVDYEAALNLYQEAF